MYCGSAKLEIFNMIFGDYNSGDMKLGISPIYSATLGLNTGCHGFFILLDICHCLAYKVWSKLRYV